VVEKAGKKKVDSGGWREVASAGGLRKLGEERETRRPQADEIVHSENGKRSGELRWPGETVAGRRFQDGSRTKYSAEGRSFDQIKGWLQSVRESPPEGAWWF